MIIPLFPQVSLEDGSSHTFYDPVLKSGPFVLDVTGTVEVYVHLTEYCEPRILGTITDDLQKLDSPTGVRSVQVTATGGPATVSLAL